MKGYLVVTQQLNKKNFINYIKKHEIMTTIISFPSLNSVPATIAHLATLDDYIGVEGAHALALGLETGTIQTTVPSHKIWTNTTEYSFNDPRVYARLTQYEKRGKQDATSTLFLEALLLRHMLIDLYVSIAPKDTQKYLHSNVEAALTEKRVLEKLYGTKGIASTALTHAYLCATGPLDSFLQSPCSRPSLELIEGEL